MLQTIKEENENTYDSKSSVVYCIYCKRYHRKHLVKYCKDDHDECIIQMCFKCHKCHIFPNEPDWCNIDSQEVFK